MGDTASCELAIDEPLIDAFAAFSADVNSLHMDAEFAKQRGFGGRVAHGMIALSAISRLIGTQLPGHGSLWASQELQFAQPVMVGDRLEARVTVERVSAGAQMVVLKTEVINLINQAVVLRGTARVRIPAAK